MLLIEESWRRNTAKLQMDFFNPVLFARNHPLCGGCDLGLLMASYKQHLNRPHAIVALNFACCIYVSITLLSKTAFCPVCLGQAMKPSITSDHEDYAENP